MLSFKNFLFAFCALMPLTASAHLISLSTESAFSSTVAASSTQSAAYLVTNLTNATLPGIEDQSTLPAGIVISSASTCGAHTPLTAGSSCYVQLQLNAPSSGTIPSFQLKEHVTNTMDAVAINANAITAISAPLTPFQNWISNLASPYEAVQGNVFLMTNSECPTFVSIFDSCFGQNPAAPYIVPQPPIEDSYVDPYYAVPLETAGPDGTTDIIYRLGNNDALITIVSFPPQVTYLGYQSYVFTSETSNYTGITPPRDRTVSPDPDRYDILGSVGNDMNSIIATSQYGAPWGKTMMYITTANQTLANALIANATAAGIDPHAIIVEPLGSNVITGNDEAADDLLTLIRYAIPYSSSQSNAWINNLNSNVLVYKVTNDSLGVSRYGTNQYTAHKINTSETGYAPSLRTAQQQLVALLQTYLHSKQITETSNELAETTTTVNSEGVPTSGLVGSNCIYYGTNCEADNQDTSTYTNQVLSHLGLDETAFIVGVNHAVPKLNNNRYTSVDIYDAATSSGVASSSQTNASAAGFSSGNLIGSAQQVLTDLGIAIPSSDTALLANIGQLYVTFIARNCNNHTIAAAQAYCINLEGTSLVPLIDPLSITERSYILPGQTAGGNVDDMLYPYTVAAASDFES